MDFDSQSLRLYLCRHGETEWTLSGQHTSRTDLPLTQQGQKQAAFLRQRLARVSFEKVFTSPRLRSIETCEGMNPIKDPHLVEWDYGDYEGLTFSEIQNRKKSWSLFADGAPGGESPEQVSSRADQFLASIQNQKGNIAIFSHGHFLRVLAARFLGLNPAMGKIFNLSVASLSILGYEKRNPVILLWNEGFVADKISH